MKLNPFLPLRGSHEPAPPDHAKIRQAARGFEGLFLAQLFKVMKQSVTMGKKDGMFRSDGLGEFAEEEFARALADRKSIGLTDMLDRSLSRDKITKLDPAAEGGIPLKAARKAAVPLRHASVPLAVARPPLAGQVKPPVTMAAPPVMKAEAPLAPLPQPSTDIDPIIERAAERNDLHPNLLRAVINCESGGDRFATSPKGAKGLMQLVDSTASMLGVRNVWSPTENIEGGARYLRSLLDRFDGRLDWALAAYNAGPTAVERHRGIPPYDETQAYVQKVLQQFQKLGAEARLGS